MENTERRRLILQQLKTADSALTGRELALLCKVSRQIIVSDIAMLRAEGEKILATSQGYLIEQVHSHELKALLLYSDGQNALIRELELIVDNGGLIRGVSIEYGPYGCLSAKVMLGSRRDIRRWMENLDEIGMKPLALLAGGTHRLLVEMENEEEQEEICRLLKETGYLREEKEG